MSVAPSPGYVDRRRATQLLEKWKPVLDFSSDTVAPLEEAHKRLSTAVLLENQENWCHLEESNSAGTGGAFGTHQPTAGPYSGDNYASGDARLPKVLIPMIRRTFPELITNEIVGVQPMSGPVGLAFALRYKYDATSLNNGGAGSDSGVTPTNQPAAQISDGQEVGWNYLNTAFTGTSSDTLTGKAGTGFDNVQVDNGVAALMSQFELNGNIPQMTIQFEKTAVEAGTRRLAAKWSVELEQDLKSMNGIDIDNELTNAMSYEIQAEIDREMIMRMIQICLNAGTASPSKGTGYSFWYAASADARWLGERNRDFYARVIVEANRVAINNRRGPANFIVATPRVCAMLEMLPEFKFMAVNGTVNTQPAGIAKVGSVGGRFNVYRDTRTEAQYQVNTRTSVVEYALLGYKGAEYYDTGIVYCPYIPVMIQRTIGPNDFAPRVGLLTRYAVVDHLFGSELFYHMIICKNIGDAFSPGAASIYL
tara:strand:+ start:7037 stop:8473 length:1437 start_codon:yes stop_codon:yes gene_type:complete